MNNNSWYYFEHVVNGSDTGVDYYFIANKNKNNLEIYSKLSKKTKRNIVWRNSLRHQLLYLRADMYFVTLSYKDILPDIYSGKNVNIKHTVYLQHGNTAMKKLGYARDAYSNSMFKFITYGPKEGDIIIEGNGFSSHQIMQSDAHPRYKKLVRLNRESGSNNGGRRQILWFLTWREYINEGGVSQEVFSKKINEVISNEALISYLHDNNIDLKLVMHQFFNKKSFTSEESDSSNISICHADETDLMLDIAQSELLITDYSSIGFDFTFLKKPVLLYQFDSLMYATKREFYCDLEKDLGRYAIDRPEDLINSIISGEWSVNKFFEERLPKNIDYKKVEEGYYIDELNRYFVNAQKNKISIVGYNFFGRGGTVTATLALVEGLADLGYMIELVSLKRIKSNKIFPGGVILKSFMNPWRSFSESLKYRLFNKDIDKTHLKYDCNKGILIPYVDFALRRHLSKTKSSTIISTREPLHLYLDECKNPSVINKLYFFHTPATAMESVFPGVMDAISKIDVKKALFVTENSKKELADIFGYSKYSKYEVTGNALSSSDTIEEKDIAFDNKSDDYIYKGIVLTRVSRDRSNDVHRLIEFAKYLNLKKVKNIQIDVFGSGDYVYELCDLIKSNKVGDIVKYKGLTEDPKSEIQSRDFLVDFSESHSFGMIYLEAVLNGVYCFAASNAGSKEVLKGIPKSIYENWEELYEYLQDMMANGNEETLKGNYRKLQKRYSRLNVAKSVINLID